MAFSSERLSEEKIGKRLSITELKQLERLVKKYSDWVRNDEPMASQVLDLVYAWVKDDIG